MQVIQFKFDNERPIYLQLVEQLRVAIVSGAYAAGSRLPSVRELAVMAKVNPNTMQKALTELESDRLIFTERTNGKYVTNDQRLLAKIKTELAAGLVKNYTGEMAKICITYAESIKYLKQLGGH
ncbi:GntR family transcriptional regulator [Candidatus Saccharibacteria bacterium]|nr:GntR family transcriptional regulator [Candidatus Saccharibacteria bacterium]